MTLDRSTKCKHIECVSGNLVQGAHDLDVTSQQCLCGLSVAEPGISRSQRNLRSTGTLPCRRLSMASSVAS